MTIEALFAGNEWTPQQCLIEALNGADEMECVVVAYLVKDSEGDTKLRSSKSSAMELLWLGNAIKAYAIKG